MAMGEIWSRGHVAAQSSWAPKKPSATAVHDGEQSRRSGSVAYSRADRCRRRSFSWLGVTVQICCENSENIVKCCVFLCVYTGRRVPPVLYLDGNLDGTGRVRALCVPALFRLPPVSFNRNRAMEGRRDGLRGRGFCAPRLPLLSYS